ncbi:MAG: transposase [Acetobacteraceae bacterium]|nr:transposase [Acetobacteraceae bacterium]
MPDRCGSYDWIAATHRQVCWSHLRRDFQAMIDRGGPAEPIGRRLLRLSDRLFRWWHRLEDEKGDRERFRAAMTRLRREVKAALRDGTRGSSVFKCKTGRKGLSDRGPSDGSA